jgi:hypothetical protein
MSERLRALRHHIEKVETWDNPNMTPEEVARQHIDMWNNPPFVKPNRSYPETQEFINGFVRIIEAHRNGEEIIPLDDFNDDRTQDPMCRACMICPNPIRDLQLRLPGFHKIVDVK